MSPWHRLSGSAVRGIVMTHALSALTVLSALLLAVACGDDGGGAAADSGGGPFEPTPEDYSRPGQDCTDDYESCPEGHLCHCGGPGIGPWPCACGLECEEEEDCVDPDQPVCCYGACTDVCSCSCP